MTTSMSDLQNLTTEYQSFVGTYYSAGDSLQRVLAAGTVLYNDANFTIMFPASSAAYKAYLVSLQTYINTFLAGLPVAPPITG